MYTTVIDTAAARMPPPALELPPTTAIDTTRARSREGNANGASVTSTSPRPSQPPT
jgi:hypothetical protein